MSGTTAPAPAPAPDPAPAPTPVAAAPAPATPVAPAPVPAAPASWLLFATEAEALKAARTILAAMGSEEERAYPVSQPAQSSAPAGWVLPDVDDAFLNRVTGYTRVASVALVAGAPEPMLRAPAKARTADVRALLKAMPAPGQAGVTMLQAVLADMAANENDTQDANSETTFDRTKSPLAVSLRKLGMTDAALSKLLADANAGHAVRVEARVSKIRLPTPAVP